MLGEKELSDEIKALLANKKNKQFQELARLLTLLEKCDESIFKYHDLFEPEHISLRIGITGPPGAGKSTLINSIIKELRKKNLTVGVLAVDPSSPFTNGAILGDRIRFAESYNDPGVFIRSVGSRGVAGGLSASTYLMLRAYDAWKFDVVLIETVGVGQTELEIMYAADKVFVVLVPEAGDAIQAMKAGLLEIADIFVVNKADRPGSEMFARELKESLSLGEGVENIDVITTAALENKGIDKLTNFIFEELKSKNYIEKRNSPIRLRAEARALLIMREQKKLEKKLYSINSTADLKKIFK